ncbi:cupin domain-containing protein [Kitasatospora fiedleri]|uniref:cupin domain-containing protein n=1 Tax=Kitasatospora fiedleri TaxID=2991545 RepID=UPI000C2CD974|nr:cupin domain-containing protein [Kitasatospora fiedleri]
MTDNALADSAVAENGLAECLPVLFTELAGGRFDFQELEFEPLLTDGRVGAEIHRLYTTEQTGPAGPAAAIVRYLPGAAAKPHRHPGYELIYICSGQLETDEGVYPANSLLVMKPDSVHAPRSANGCIALVVWEQPVQPV